MNLLQFQSHVKKTPTCWLWQGLKTAKGYGRYGKGGRRAHRIAYSEFIGEIPSGLLVLHSCDNPSCVNPNHLFLGTSADNTKDMVTKGRARGKDHTGMTRSSETRLKLSAAKTAYWRTRREAA